MARARSPDRVKAEAIYLKNKGNIELVKIAEILDRPQGTVRGWKNKDKWDDKLNGMFQEKSKKNAERSKKKKGGQPGNKNAVGHGPPKENKNAEKHGFFSKYLPEETLDIIQEINEKDPLDILWENIQIQYAAIIRAQRIMHVESKEEMIKELKKEKSYESESISSSETEYEFQFAWDRQATFLKAQSRAMGELRSLIKQYNELVDRGMGTKEQELRIQKLQLEIDKISNDDNNKMPPSITIVDAWSDEDE
ncbi:MAG: phage terminase small subunit [Tissierellaceae bacterium]